MENANDPIKRGLATLTAQLIRWAQLVWQGFSAAAWLMSFLVWLLSRGVYEPARLILVTAQMIMRVIWVWLTWAVILLNALLRASHKEMKAKALRTGIAMLRFMSARDGAAFLCALIATGLIVSLWGLQPPPLPLSAPASAAESGNDPVLARINQTPIHLSDVAAYAYHTGQLDRNEDLHPAIAWRRGLVTQTIEQFLIVTAARESDLIDQPALKAQMRAAQHRIIAAAFLDNKLKAALTPKAIWEIYESQLDALSRNDEFRLSVIETASPETAKAVKKAVDLGLTFEEMARKYSEDTSTAQFGGDLGYVRLINFPEPISQIILSLSKGETSRPLQYGKRWYLYQLTDRRRTAPPSFSRVKENIRSYLSDEMIITLLEELKEKNQIKLYN